jgi:hypothetical protein
MNYTENLSCHDALAKPVEKMKTIEICRDIREELEAEKEFFTMRDEIITNFIREVEKEAELAMLQPPHKLEGQHYAAMKRVAKRMGIDVWKDNE